MTIHLPNINNFGKSNGGGGGSTSGASLYDIKVMSQLVAEKGFLKEKGWALLCKNTRQDLAKVDVPTLYNDILNKYNNCDKSYNVSTISNTSYSNVMYDDYSHKYYYRDTSVKLYSSDNADLSNSSEVNLGSGNISDFFMLGDNINITTYGFNTSGSDYYIYDKDWNYIKTIHFDREYNNVVKFRKVNGSFVIFLCDSDPYHKVCYLIKISDDENANVTISSNYFNSVSVDSANNISDVIDDKIYISLNRNGYYITFLEIDYTNLSLIQVYNANTLDSDGYGNLTNIVKYNNTFYYGNLTKLYSSSDLVNWTEVHSFSTFIYYIEKYNDTYYIISNGYITKTTDFSNFETIITFTGTSNDYDNGYIYGYFNNQIIITFSTFVSFTPLYLYASDVATIYTDNYNINGNEVEIDYCKNGSYKICLADNTNDTNLATVYSYMGYYNYYRLDIANETISLPRNNNLYSMMYVGDNYQDTTTDIPNGEYIPYQTKIKKFTNISASTWVADNTYTGYGYKCELTCNGVTANDFAQVIFNTTEAESGNYATVCNTGNGIVTIYSKVNTSIIIPTIIVIGA